MRLTEFLIDNNLEDLELVVYVFLGLGVVISLFC